MTFSFFTDDVGYRRWNLGLDFMGFTKSLGKNFFHHDYGYMNSVPFQYDWKLNQFETFPFYNVACYMAVNGSLMVL